MTADGTVSTLDAREWDAALARLTDPKLRESLARSMAVAGGKVLRDEAKARAPVDSGKLKSSLYLAHREGESTPERQVYRVSWNARVAPHGHLLEFGHWQTHVMYQKGGEWKVGAPLASPKWVPAKPFIRPAFDAAQGRAQKAMIDRGRQRLPELLRGADEPGK